MSMRPEETLGERVGRLAALWLETDAGLAVNSWHAGIALALQAMPPGKIILPLSHAERIDVPLLETVRAAGRCYGLVGTTDGWSEPELKSAIDDPQTAAGCFLHSTGRPVAEFVWQWSQARKPVIVAVATPKDALGIADSHAELIVTQWSGIGIVAGSAARIEQLRTNPWRAIVQVQEAALAPASVWVERQLACAEDIGQIAGSDLDPGPFGKVEFKSHDDGTLTPTGSTRSCGS